MKAGSLIGFTEAELALILLVVFAVVLPTLPKGGEAGPNPPEPTPVSAQVHQRTLDSLKAAREALRRSQDSLRVAQARIDSANRQIRLLKDSVRISRAGIGPVASGGRNRSPYDPECRLIETYRGPARPVNPIRILDDGYEMDGNRFSLDGLALRLRGYTELAESLRCRFPMTVIVSATLPAGRLEQFRQRFQNRYFVRASVEN